jgi:hypothetical protein
MEGSPVKWCHAGLLCLQIRVRFFIQKYFNTFGTWVVVTFIDTILQHCVSVVATLASDDEGGLALLIRFVDVKIALFVLPLFQNPSQALVVSLMSSHNNGMIFYEPGVQYFISSTNLFRVFSFFPNFIKCSLWATLVDVTFEFNLKRCNGFLLFLMATT